MESSDDRDPWIWPRAPARELKDQAVNRPTII